MKIRHGVPIVPIDRLNFEGRLRSGFGPYSPMRQYRYGGRSLTDDVLVHYSQVHHLGVTVDMEYYRKRVQKLTAEYEHCQASFLTELRMFQTAACPDHESERLIKLFLALTDMSNIIKEDTLQHIRIRDRVKVLF